MTDEDAPHKPRRAHRRTGYTHYPQEYFRMLNNLREGETQRVGPMGKVEAENSRRKLYTFFDCLRDYYKIDSFAREMSEIANSLVLTIEGDDIDGYFIVAGPDPFIVAYRNQNQKTS